ncbi:MAG: hypothetical protein V2A54_14240 [Bacteroidota bacterium]
MENEENKKQDCECGTDCCTPKKSKCWMKILFIVIIAAALTIVVVKLTGKSNDEATPKQDTVKTQKAGAADSAKSCNKPCGSDKKSSCCPGGE